MNPKESYIPETSDINHPDLHWKIFHNPVIAVSTKILNRISNIY